MANAKISELAQIRPVGAGLIVPGARGGQNVAVHGHRIAPSRPFAEMWADGDSKSGEGPEAARWALARNPMDVWVTGVNLGIGGTNSGSAADCLTNATRLAAMQAAVAAAYGAGRIVDMILTIGTNDLTASMAPETTIANIRKYHDAFRLAGGRYLILMAVDPRSANGAARVSLTMSLNNAYADYCAAVSDAMFCDPTPWWTDPAQPLSHAPIGGAAGAAMAVTGDGLHGSAYGGYRKQYAILTVMQRLYRATGWDVAGFASDYDTANAARASILGINGRMVAMGGTNAITGGAGVTGTPPADFRSAGELSGTMALTYSVQSNAHLGALYGGTWPCVRIAVTGTPTADTDILIAGRNWLLDQQGALPMRGRALIGCNALVGCMGLFTVTQNVSPTGKFNLGRDGGYPASDQLPQLDGLHMLDLRHIPTGNSNSGLNLWLRVKAGVAAGGSIDLIGMDWRRWAAMPVATA
ncbi:SGNH/GDSL hydrolase family protein [Sphingomonas sp. KC8]|uniref:SGNH/GDSL hydrolase family protein n=1 Tax=Sphingomonas sp. KC8 TaxID=1030157 RepID=UPI00024897D5|nr:SGNH/GDSL hydrolase family protein [Sphingomonas sp. KC8]ARS29098.1 hypothetical protein KC8_17650 [Sphingomonas sp. KC8]